MVRKSKGCSPTACQFNHDHHDEEGVALTCGDCLLPIHYDYDAEEYRHDDPAALACFLIGA